MSAVNATCFPIAAERESGAGEMKCMKPIQYSESNTTANLIASEIVNDILENALDLAMANSVLSPKVEKISTNIVGDILEGILSPSCSDSPNERQDETALLDDEIKQMIKDMKNPPEAKSLMSTKGVGDQLANKSEISAIPPEAKRNTLERKNRLTNLVKNSKQMFSKLVTNDTEKELRAVKSEETSEKIVKIIDLENPEELSSKSDACTKRPVFPTESSMDVVELDQNQRGDVLCDTTDKSESENESKTESSEEKKKKKKWNLGSKFMKILKRNPKREEKKSSEDN